MPPRKSAKRTASSGERSTSKKTRFLDPQDDPVNFAEEVDSQLEDPASKRKGKVKTEGYDSDSSDDGEGVVLSRKAGIEDEDDDMFAAGENDKNKATGSGKKTKDEYLHLGDIEGQEFGKSGLGSESSEEDEEPVDEDEAERRQKAGMGYELSSFNMREEMEEGKFSADGMYVKSYDPHAVHDRWMDGLDEREIKRARKNRRQRERAQREKLEAEEKELEELGGRTAVEKELLAKLKKGETVLEALQRLGSKSKSSTKGSRKHKSSGNVDKQPTSEIDQITHLASTLMSLGDTDIYSKGYEQLVRSVRSSGQVDSSWEPPSADVNYEYKWVASTNREETFGPFSEDLMNTWYKANYFGPVGEKVKVKPVGGEWGDWDGVFT